MIDEFCIFHRGGTVLWRKSYVPLINNDALAAFVRTVLLEERLSLNQFCYNSCTLLWRLDNLRSLVYVVIYQTKLPPTYANELLELVRNQFSSKLQYTTSTHSKSKSIDTCANYHAFTPLFEQLLTIAEQRARENAPRKQPPSLVPSTATETQSCDHQHEQQNHKHETPNLVQEKLTKRARIIRNRQMRAEGLKSAKSTKSNPTTKTDTTNIAPKPREKLMRPSSKSIQQDGSILDFSTPRSQQDASPQNDYDDAKLQEFRKRYLPSANHANTRVSTSLSDYDDDDYDDADDDADDETENKMATGVFSYFKGLAGMRTLTRTDLEPVMNEFRDFLIGKNVAQNIADKLMESVATSLEGKQMESLTSVRTTVRKALDEALTRTLTGGQGTDIVAEISANKRTGRPYVIAFCGVNGVGKSTTVAKTCYYLLQQGLRVMIAACDTFRAGAVEQLRTHVRCLGEGVELFDKGYGKDAAAVAADAIRRAGEGGFDVVLVDTAGRMQDKEPLMRALAKLVEVNSPDRVLFVGEALVGNDAVDQLTKFNRALAELQSGAHPHLIDGIVLTKMDTIDDKVGAAVSMVYVTGQPIVFVGVGQTYTDLRRVNTRSLVNALLR